MTADQARALFLAGDIEAARRAYDEAIEAQPGDARLLAGRAGLRAYLGDADGARSDVDAALRADPRTAEAWLIRARLRGPDGLEDLERALILVPDWTAALYWRGVFTGSADDLRQAARSDTTDPRDLNYQATAWAALRDDRRALEASDRALAAGFRLPSIRYLRAQIRSRRGERKEAIQELDGLIAGPSPLPAYFVDRGREYLHLEQAQRAVEDFDRALALRPGHIPALYYRAVAVRAGAEELRRIRDLEARSTDDYYFRALAHEGLGEAREAARDFGLALRSAPIDHPRRAELEAKARPPVKRTSSGRAPATIALLGACVAVWILQGDLFARPDTETLVERGALARIPVWIGEYWRMLTAMFLHIGPMHLALNVYFGYAWCRPVEHKLGAVRFLVLYVFSGLTGSALSLLGHDAVSAGASGALFGAIGAVLYFWRDALGSFRAFFEHPQVRSVLGMMALWFVLGFTILPMDNYAHFGGLASGFLWAWLFLRPRSRVGLATAALLSLGICAAAAVPWYAPEDQRDPGRLRAIQAARTGDLVEAERQLTLLIDRSPRDPDLYVHRGAVRASRNDVDGAVADLKRALEVAPPGWDDSAARRLLEGLQ